jgi:hypothetical protein
MCGPSIPISGTRRSTFRSATRRSSREHLNLIEIDDAAVLDQVVNKIHDLKHAFDLQGIEIKAYYTTLNGKYLPRQPVTFESI